MERRAVVAVGPEPARGWNAGNCTAPQCPATAFNDKAVGFHFGAGLRGPIEIDFAGQKLRSRTRRNASSRRPHGSAQAARGREVARAGVHRRIGCRGIREWPCWDVDSRLSVEPRGLGKGDGLQSVFDAGDDSTELITDRRGRRAFLRVRKGGHSFVAGWPHPVCRGRERRSTRLSHPPPAQMSECWSPLPVPIRRHTPMATETPSSAANGRRRTPPPLTSRAVGWQTLAAWRACPLCEIRADAAGFDRKIPASDLKRRISASPAFRPTLRERRCSGSHATLSALGP